MAAALTLGLRGHRVVVLEAAPKVRGAINIMLESEPLLTRTFIVDGGWSWNPSLTKHAKNV